MNRTQEAEVTSLLVSVARNQDLLRRSTVADELPNLESFLKLAEDPLQLRKNLRFLEYHLALAGARDITGKDVLDAGSGLGMGCLIYSVLSGKPATGIEKSDHLFTISSEMMKTLPTAVRPAVYHGDVSAMPFEDESFDVVTCFEAISHFRNPLAGLREMGRVCRKGGALIISDGNNAVNRQIRSKTLEYWTHFEKGPSGTYTADRYHYIDVCYEDVRRQIIRKRYPSISAKDRDMLAAGTFGMNEGELRRACEEFLTSSRRPESMFDGTHVPVDPAKDDVRENLFDPILLARDLREYGFEAKAYPYFGAARNAFLRAANLAVAWACPPAISLRWSKLFIVAGRKVR